MASLIRLLFSCCLPSRRKEDENGERERLLGSTGVHGVNTVQYTNLEPSPRDTEGELNQKVADLVSNGTNRMIAPGRFNPLYSSASAQLSSSQAHLTVVSSSHPALHADALHIDSQQSSHSSPHSSFQPTNTYPHNALSEAQASEDGGLSINASQSVTSLAQNNPSGPSALPPLGGVGAAAPPAIGRRFQIHRGRPPSRRGAAETNLGTRTQANGVLSPAEPADEHTRTSEASPSRTTDVDPPPPPPPSSPPLRIRSAQGESASRERTPNDNEKRQVHFKLPPQNDLLVEFDP